MEPGPQDGTLLVTWQPVIRPPAGASGPVTGYAGKFNIERRSSSIIPNFLILVPSVRRRKEGHWRWLSNRRPRFNRYNETRRNQPASRHCPHQIEGRSVGWQHGHADTPWVLHFNRSKLLFQTLFTLLKVTFVWIYLTTIWPVGLAVFAMHRQSSFVFLASPRFFRSRREFEAPQILDFVS